MLYYLDKPDSIIQELHEQFCLSVLLGFFVQEIQNEHTRTRN